MEIFIKTTPDFEKKSAKALTSASVEALYDYLESHPEAGDIIRGTGGIRKLRWKTGKNNKGKSGGVRVLYYYKNEILILIITLYSKSDQDNISDAERNELKRSLPKLIDKYLEDIQ
jgi:mRNA-degrading endonuclease RelE of RelBE toxin-antitoxin system